MKNKNFNHDFWKAVKSHQNTFIIKAMGNFMSNNDSNSCPKEKIILNSNKMMGENLISSETYRHSSAIWENFCYKNFVAKFRPEKLRYK